MEEIEIELLLEKWQIECASTCLALQQKVKAVRDKYSKRQRKHDKKFENHIIQETPSMFVQQFSRQLSNYHKKMTDVAKNKKKKELPLIL